MGISISLTTEYYVLRIVIAVIILDLRELSVLIIETRDELIDPLGGSHVSASLSRV